MLLPSQRLLKENEEEKNSGCGEHYRIKLSISGLTAIRRESLSILASSFFLSDSLSRFLYFPFHQLMKMNAKGGKYFFSMEIFNRLN